MRSSCICPSARATRGVAAGLLAAIAASCAIATLSALDRDRALPQYIRDRWDGSTGFQGGPVYAISQTVDGYLWIAAEKGLVRFDGLSFRLFQPTEPATGGDAVALQITPSPDGTLWARLRRADFVHYRNGAYEHVFSAPGSPTLMSTAMSPGNDGAIVVADQNRGVFLAREARFDTIVPKEALPRSFVLSVAQTQNGDIWLGTRDTGLVRVRGRQVVPVTDGLPDQKVNCLVAGGRDQLWVGTDNGVARWDGNRVTHAGLPAGLAGVRVTAMITDRDANLWVGTADRLLRVSTRGLVSLDRSTPGSGVTALFEDRDGNLWIGTQKGIERWRDGAFTTYPEVNTATAGDAGPIFLDATERVWFAPSSGGLNWLRDGHVERVTSASLGGDVVYSLDGNGNDLWIGRQRGGLTHLQTHGDAVTTETFTQTNGLAQDNVYAVYRSRDGAVWAGTLSGGVSRIKDGVFTTYTTAQGLASNTVASILEAADGTMWFATPNGASARSATGWRRYSTADGLPSDDVNTLFEDSVHDVWIGTAAGVAMVRDGQVQSGLQLPESLRASILGIVEDSTGWMWIASADRVLRVDRERLLHGSRDDSAVREYGAADGLRGIEGVKRHRSLAADSHGRIWLSTSGGLAMVDPVRLAGRSAAALVHVEGVSADGSPVNLAGEVRIPPRRQRVTLAFTALSLSVAERVRFRYRLDGFDRDWSEPVAARQAVYTNLGPGAYRFRVIASNSDGIWNSAEAALRFTVAPALWQTMWFRAASVIAVAALLWAGHQVRLRQIARRFEALQFERDFELAARIQANLFPAALPVVAGYDIAARNRPARRCGGDYYDVLPHGAGGSRLLLCVADVSGKGMAAALLMSHTQATLRALVGQNRSLPVLATQASDLLFAVTATERYVTAALVDIDPSVGSGRFVSAGHVDGLLMRASGEVVQLASTGTPLGLFSPGLPYDERIISIEPGDCLVLFSDGVTDAQNAAGEEFGSERLLDIIEGSRTQPAAIVVDRVFEAIDTFASGAAQFDDITIMLLQRRPTSRPSARQSQRVECCSSAMIPQDRSLPKVKGRRADPDARGERAPFRASPTGQPSVRSLSHLFVFV